MNAHTSLLGVYRPGDGWLFRLPIGWKYLLMLAIALPPVLLREWWSTAAALVVVLLAMLTSRISLSRILGVGWYLWVLLGVMVAYQLISLLPVMAFVGPEICWPRCWQPGCSLSPRRPRI